jgi:hypothetical protein
MCRDERNVVLRTQDAAAARHDRRMASKLGTFSRALWQAVRCLRPIATSKEIRATAQVFKAAKALRVFIADRRGSTLYIVVDSPRLSCSRLYVTYNEVVDSINANNGERVISWRQILENKAAIRICLRPKVTTFSVWFALDPDLDALQRLALLT